MIASSIQDIQPIGCFDDTPRGRLLLGAAYLFHKQGYAKTTVRDLAQFIGMQSGSLFHHFKSKDDILAAVMEQTIVYNHACLETAIAHVDEPEQQLKQLIKAELHAISGDTGSAMAVLVYEWFALSTENQKKLLKLRHNYEAIWLNIMQVLHDQGKVKHDPFIWRRLIGGSIAWTVTWYQPEGQMTLDQLTDIVWDLTLGHSANQR